MSRMIIWLRRYVSVDSSGRKSSVDESGDSTVSLNMKAKTFAASKRSNINARYGLLNRIFINIIFYIEKRLNLESTTLCAKC